MRIRSGKVAVEQIKVSEAEDAVASKKLITRMITNKNQALQAFTINEEEMKTTTH